MLDYITRQTRIQQPEQLFPRVIAAFKTVPDPELQHRMMAVFLHLMDDKELIAMIEKLIEEDDMFANSPYNQRLREEREQGMLIVRRHDILEVVQIRFDPRVSVYQSIESPLATLTNESHLHTLFLAALQAPDLAAFQIALDRPPPQNGA